MRAASALVLAVATSACATLPGAQPPFAAPLPILLPAPAAVASSAPPPKLAVPSLPASSSPAPTRKEPAPAPSPEHLLQDLFARGGDALKGVAAAPETYRFQVLYSIVHEGSAPSLERHGFRTDAEYFYPASSMKMPITLALYDRLGILRSAQPGLSRDATMKIHPVAGSGEPYVTSIARETWRALIVSDNTSANRLLGIVGHREAHETLWGLGLASARIRAGFATGGDIDPAELSPRIELTGAELPARKSDLVLPPTNAKGLDIGKANIVDGKRVEGPLSFADKNAMLLRELQDTLVHLVRPDLLPKGSKPDTASADDLSYVRQALGTLPSESGLAGYDRNVVQDYRLIPFLRGIERVRARGKFTIQSKVGQAYGFLVGNAYVVDKETGRAFFLTAAVYANPDETMNDDNYAYDAIAYPALADLAEVVSRHAFGL